MISTLFCGDDERLPAAVQSVVASPVEVGWAAKKWGDPVTVTNAKDKKGEHTPDLDAGSLATMINARVLWAQEDDAGRAVTGRGVTVVVLDTGIDTATEGLDGAGKVSFSEPDPGAPSFPVARPGRL